MKLFLISQDFNSGYDTYNEAVVAAPTAEIAKRIDPATGEEIDLQSIRYRCGHSSWCNPEHVKVTYLGEAADDIKEGLICSSFNAG